MVIDSVSVELRRTDQKATLLCQGRPYGLSIKITLHELEQLADQLQRDARVWRRECSVPAVDYYLILGVPRHATADEIQSAYRHLAKQCHPDTSSEHTGAAMTQLNHVYKVLSDPKQRTEYDQVHD